MLTYPDCGTELLLKTSALVNKNALKRNVNTIRYIRKKYVELKNIPKNTIL